MTCPRCVWGCNGSSSLQTGRHRWFIDGRGGAGEPAGWLLDGCWMAAGWLLDGCWMAAGWLLEGLFVHLERCSLCPHLASEVSLGTEVSLGLLNLVLQVCEQTRQTSMIPNPDNQLSLSVFFQDRNETIKNPGGKITRGKLLLFSGPASSSSSSPSCGEGRAEGSALCHCFSRSWKSGIGTRRCSGPGRRLCDDGLRSAARGAAAAGGAAAGCGRHHHRAALQQRAQLGKVAKWVRDRRRVDAPRTGSEYLTDCCVFVFFGFFFLGGGVGLSTA